MLEVIGFIVWFLVTVGLTLTPLAVIGLSAMGGGMAKEDKITCLILWALAAYSWYHIFSSISISVN